MQNLNTVTLIGRVGSEPEGKEINGAPVCNFRMATNRAWLDQSGQKKEVATWHRIVCWNKQAESCQQYVHKGMLVFVTGSLETREYEKDGEKRSITEIRAMQVGFLSGREGDGQAAPAAAQDRGRQGPPAGAPAPQRGYGDDRRQASPAPRNSGYGGSGGGYGVHAGSDDVPF